VAFAGGEAQNGDTRMKKRKLGSLEVPAIGFGCMVLPGFYFAGSEEQAIATLRRAAEVGVNFLDTADAYGSGKNEELVGRAIKGQRDRYIIATKFGNVWKPGLDYDVCGRPEYVAQACDESLKRLGIDTIDLYYQHRVDPAVPIEDTVGAIADLVKQGYVRFIGLSEVGAETLRRAQAVHPISDLQIEYSLASRGIERAILPAARELGIGITAYAVLSRGVLSGHWTADRPPAKGDLRFFLPRYRSENVSKNLALVEALRAIAARRGATVAQLAIAWVLAQGEEIVPLIGARRRERLTESLGALDIALSAADLAEIAAAVPPEAVAGTRYDERQMSVLDSERTSSGS
jgi:aryl-alcohol dehydrogenase-like predicted oxidoreductase